VGGRLPNPTSFFKFDDSWETIILSSKGLKRISFVFGGWTLIFNGISSTFYLGIGIFFSDEGCLGLEL
jgi:hypothetical protein